MTLQPVVAVMMVDVVTGIIAFGFYFNHQRNIVGRMYPSN
jgi:hypothetical protein